MDDERISRIAFFVILLLLFVGTIILLRPLATAIILSVVLTYLFYPWYTWILGKVKNVQWSAALMTLIVLLVFVIPIGFVVVSLIVKGANGISALQDQNAYILFRIPELSAWLSHIFHTTIDLQVWINSAVTKIAKFLLEVKGPALINEAAEIFVGVFAMFFVMYYLFKGGKGFIQELKELIPLKQQHKVKLFSEVEDMLHAVIYGQVITAFIQGALLGIGFYVTGVPHALFWMFITTLLCFIPYIGTPIIFMPTAAYLYLTHHGTAALGLLIYGFVILTNIDNVIKPKIIGKRARVHPVLVLLGVIGGLKVFGLIGLLIGPIILSLFIVFLRFYATDFLRTDH